MVMRSVEKPRIKAGARGQVERAAAMFAAYRPGTAGAGFGAKRKGAVPAAGEGAKPFCSGENGEAGFFVWVSLRRKASVETSCWPSFFFATSSAWRMTGLFTE